MKKAKLDTENPKLSEEKTKGFDESSEIQAVQDSFTEKRKEIEQEMLEAKDKGKTSFTEKAKGFIE